MKVKEILPASILLFFLSIPTLSFGQYFERNKVQYRTFDFFVKKTDHFLVHHYPRSAEAALDSALMLERWYERHAEALGFGLEDRQKVILYNNFVDFEQTNAVSGLIPPEEGGITESLDRRIIVPLTGIYAENFHVLGHELVHAFQMEPRTAPSETGAQLQRQPTWFVEGQAEYLSLGPDDPLTSMWMRDAVLNVNIPSIDDLSWRPDEFFPYRFGHAVWAWIDRTWGKEGVRSFFGAAMSKGIATAVDSALHEKSLDEFSRKWKDDLLKTTMPQLAGRTLPENAGRTLPGIGRGTNLSPVVSPDGEYIAVFSRRDTFNFALYLADAANGRVFKTLAGSENDASFDALRFIDSAGTWSPDSRSFAFTVEKDGSDAVAVADVPGGVVRKVLRLKDVAGVSNLAWSPDGGHIALSGTRDGIRDLYLLDPDTGSLEQLTDDWHAEIQPAWSPNSRTLAFAVDRGAKTDKAGLSFGSMNIGFMDMATRQIRIVSLKDGAKHINPQFSPDGRALYFVSDPDGFSDIYRYDLDSEEFLRVTNVATGVSGLTRLSPCLSVTRSTGELVFLLFSRGSYEVHALSAEQSRGIPVAFEGGIPAQALAGEGGGAGGGSGGGSGGPTTARETAATAPYVPRFDVLAVSQANVGLTVSSFGTSVGGAAALLVQDVLGDHDIGVIAQSAGTLETFGAQIFYLNKKQRINWGIGAVHAPQQTYSYLPPAQFGNPQADTAIVQESIFTEEADVLAAYPLSVNRRWEAQTGYSHVWYPQTALIYYYRNGDLISQGQIPVSAPSPLDLFYGGLAYVGDYSYFGLTDPAKGYRYRFEADQTIGSLFYLTALADVRAYFLAKPFTFAFRALHLGRYLGDAESARLSALFIGRPDLIRGYEYYSVSTIEGAGSAGNVPQLDRLFGSKIIVINAEVRLPVLGVEGLGLIRFPYLPASLVGFIDGGVAWTSGEPPVLSGSNDSSARIPVFSSGVAIRLNIAGAFVLQLYTAFPFQRPGVTNTWGFVLAAGW